MNRTLLLFILIVVEGYVVLSTELLAIRQSIPYVGSGTDTVSIIIAAVLMPLAAGYYFGGRYSPRQENGRYCPVRRKLLRNIIMAALILLPGMSQPTVDIFFLSLLDSSLSNRIVMTAIYSLLFLVTPVFLLGQTVPLVSNYFSQEKLSRITGKMLFFSTLGSFAGAVFSTLVFMSFLGVNYTVIVNFGLLTLLTLLVGRRRDFEQLAAMAGIFAGACILNSPYVMKAVHIVENNQYNVIRIFEDGQGRHLFMNNNDSSLISRDGHKHHYIEFVEEHYITPLLGNDAVAPKSILIVGAGGFTVGFEDRKNAYVFVDIDPSLKRVAEDHFLLEKLPENKVFVAEDIRSYLARAGKKFDLIFLDAYFGDTTIPEYLVTYEFFEQVHGALAPGGVVVANFILSPGFRGRMSQNIDNTFRSVFGHVSRQVISPSGKPYNGWEPDENIRYNVIYSYNDNLDASTTTIYTDNKNAVFFDKPQKRR